jgi:hypothetical protein
MPITFLGGGRSLVLGLGYGGAGFAHRHLTRAQARPASTAFRGRLSLGDFSSKCGSTCSAQSAAQSANDWWSALSTLIVLPQRRATLSSVIERIWIEDLRFEHQAAYVLQVKDDTVTLQFVTQGGLVAYTSPDQESSPDRRAAYPVPCRYRNVILYTGCATSEGCEPSG